MPTRKPSGQKRPGTEAPSGTISKLLGQYRNGDRGALDRAVGRLYPELQHIAQVQRARWGGNHTLGTTALAHEAYLKLAKPGRADWSGRSHFLSVAARAMRQILVDYARAKKRAKRGGQAPVISLEDAESLLPGVHQEELTELVGLEEALAALEEETFEHARLVECRFFGGMTITETAEALGISPTSVKRKWRFAQAWLHRYMAGEGDPTGPSEGESS